MDTGVIMARERDYIRLNFARRQADFTILCPVWAARRTDLSDAARVTNTTEGSMNRPFAFVLIALSLAGCAAAPAPVANKSTPLPDVTIYHLEGRRSERIVWLMEELRLPYKLEFKRGDLMGSMAAIRAINPTVPMAPTVKYGDQILVESGAIIETILDRHAPGTLRPALDSADYPRYVMWMHYAEGSLAARLFSDYRAWRIQPPTQRSPLVDSQAVVQFAEEYLSAHPWFGGAEFS